MKEGDEREVKMTMLKEKLAVLEAGEINDDEALKLIDECIELAGECS
jgi:hypothetical protein